MPKLLDQLSEQMPQQEKVEVRAFVRAARIELYALALTIRADEVSPDQVFENAVAMADAADRHNPI